MKTREHKLIEAPPQNSQYAEAGAILNPELYPQTPM